jgi:2-deoxy-D-gluconate 3-dehydrogenase
VALVTAAGRGIGRATARLLAAAGALVVVTDVDPTPAAQVASDIEAAGGRAESRMLDVADEAAVVTTIAEIASRHGAIDVLVNNAGVGNRTASESMSTADWNRVVEVNLTGAFRCAREAGQSMLHKGRGAIVNVTSVMGLTGASLYPNPAYHASKAALINWTRALAVEWAGRGVRVNAVAPGYVATAYTRKVFATPEYRARILARQVLGRLIEPEEVAAAIVFLASDAASAITGITVPVDGGWSAG